MPIECISTERTVMQRMFMRRSLDADGLLTALCIVPLLLAATSDAVVRLCAVSIWLLSLALLSSINLGGAFGVYICAVALFGSQHVDGLGTPLIRPDNYGFFILIGTVVLLRGRHLRMDGLWKVATTAAILVTYALAQMLVLGILDGSRVSWFARTAAIPPLLFLLFAACPLNRSDIRAFVTALVLLGLYLAAVSFMERLHWYAALFPRWIADPNHNRTIGTGRSGGLLMQSEWNGFALTLILGVLSFAYRFRIYGARGLLLLTSLSCAAAVYFTYTRAAWLAVALGSTILLGWSARSTFQAIVVRLNVLAVSVLLLLALVFIAPARASHRLEDRATILYRFNLWNAGVAMAFDRPFVGYGYGTFAEHAGDYRGELGRFGMSAQNPQDVTVLHNTFLSIFVELGLFGLASYIALLWHVVRRAHELLLRAWGSDAIVWLAAFAALYLLQAQFLNAHEPTTNYMFYGFLGLLCGAALGNGERCINA